MASMEDLIATINGGMHVGQQGNDLKDLHAKLTQTLHPSVPNYRPIPPQTTTVMSPSGPMPPPPPVSSWNESLPAHTQSWGGTGNSPRQAGASFTGKRETGFNVPPKPSGSTSTVPPPSNGEMPYHNAVLPVRASPKDTGGFGNDAFKPLWTNGGERSQWNGFANGGSGENGRR